MDTVVPIGSRNVLSKKVVRVEEIKLLETLILDISLTWMTLKIDNQLTTLKVLFERISFVHSVHNSLLFANFFRTICSQLLGVFKVLLLDHGSG